MEADAKMDPSPVPLLSRLDRLDSVMKYLEGKQKLSNWVIDGSAGRVGKQCVPLDVAVREVQTKGSLLDRITLLEERLIQLCLEIESSSTSQSHTSTTRSCKETSSASGNSSRKYFSRSFPTFEPNQGHRHKSQLPLSRPEHQRKAALVQQKKQKQKQNHKETTTLKKQLENGKENKGEKTKSKTGKAGICIKWWHLKLLGC
ncbi:hypothetical protein RJ641_000901 [Dillenia turbinata]|uniref:Uncharacterized protein n=1 Tax=Dillenia turbinata TaxID=194707 RepID=A0AAN8WJ11_9MAGN